MIAVVEEAAVVCVVVADSPGRQCRLLEVELMQGAQVEAHSLGLTAEGIEVGVLVGGNDGGREGGG